MNLQPSSFLTEMAGFKKIDLRKKYKCNICKKPITSKNWASSEQKWGNNGFGKQIVYCQNCYLKPFEKFRNRKGK